jgi:succinyl-diaminopimelate desuccinylase
VTESQELLLALVKRPSITPNDMGCQDIVEQRLSALGFCCERLNYHATSNLWATLGEKAPSICFIGHTDVVPVGDEKKWRYPPFSGTICDGHLYARGSADMKSGIAACVSAIERFIKRKQRFQGKIALLLTSDEEGLGTDGTRRVVKELENRGEFFDYSIVAEPTSVHLFGDTIKNGRRGSLSGHLVVKGKQGHVAYPHLANNPIHRAMNALQKLITEQWDQGTVDFPPTSFQISNIQAGTGAGNVIPGELFVQFNFRFSPASSAESLKNRLYAILDAQALDYTLDWDLSGEPFVTPQGKLTEAAQLAIKQHCGIKAQINTTGGTSDGRFIKVIAREVIELGVINASIHQIDEHVCLEDVESLSQIFESMLYMLLG